MMEKAFTITDYSGLQEQSAAKLAEVASKFTSRLNLEYEDKMVDLKSEMGLISLGLEYQSGITIIAEGKDEQDAMTVIEDTLMTTNIAK